MSRHKSKVGFKCGLSHNIDDNSCNCQLKLKSDITWTIGYIGCLGVFFYFFFFAFSAFVESNYFNQFVHPLFCHRTRPSVAYDVRTRFPDITFK